LLLTFKVIQRMVYEISQLCHVTQLLWVYTR